MTKALRGQIRRLKRLQPIIVRQGLLIENPNFTNAKQKVFRMIKGDK